MSRMLSIAMFVALMGCGSGQKSDTQAMANPCGANPCAANPCAANPCGANPCAGGEAIKTGVDWSGWKSWAKVNAEPFVSKTHGKEVVDVYVNGNADAYKAMGGDMPVGFAVVKAQHKNEGGKPGAGMKLTVMTKMQPGFDSDNGDWYYGVWSYDGSKKMMEGKSDGKTEMCGNCHTGGKQDYLFGVSQ